MWLIRLRFLRDLEDAQTVAETLEAVLNYIAAAAPRVPETTVID